jgi:hypothetical protein
LARFVLYKKNSFLQGIDARMRGRRPQTKKAPVKAEAVSATVGAGSVAMPSDFVFLRMMSCKECKQAIAEKID